MPPQEIDKRQAAREVIDILHEIATLLVRSVRASISVPLTKQLTLAPLCPNKNTKLNRTQLSFCVSLIENGVNPEALAVRFKLPFYLSVYSKSNHSKITFHDHFGSNQRR